MAGRAGSPGRRGRIAKTGAAVLAAVLALTLWTAGTERKAHYVPDYEKTDLADVLGREGSELTGQDYRLLFLQTGAGKPAVDRLFETGRQEELLSLQSRFFAPVKTKCRLKGILWGESFPEETGLQERGMLVSDIREGDILMSFSSHFFGWRPGHCAVVVDAERGIFLEIQNWLERSAGYSLTEWEKYPNFIVLRVKGLTEEERAEAARYAARELWDLPYSLLCFTDCRDGEPDVSAAQCAHLVWAVYQHLGYDLDSDGKRVVTPGDILHSDLLEIVQIYGISPNDLTPAPGDVSRGNQESSPA